MIIIETHLTLCVVVHSRQVWLVRAILAMSDLAQMFAAGILTVHIPQFFSFIYFCPKKISTPVNDDNLVRTFRRREKIVVFPEEPILNIFKPL